ncbi:hypothetical protein FSST1_005683 [Fusarium sambucinum]
MASPFTFFSLVILALLLTLASAVAPIVDVSYSKYRGKDNGNGVTSWLGMRYAAPPIGDLRFMPPQDPIRSRQVKNASKFRLKCVGLAARPSLIGKSQSEDCLFINVFAPTGAARKARLPVYVFIQGGGFNGNSKPTVDGTGLIQASGMKMIVVTLNYRVSVFGFLSYGDKVQPNIGLLDQRKALQWVQRYISRFGGNPKHVVLGGNSSGAASVAFHMTMYGGRDDKLFHAASAESISSSPIVTMYEAAYRANSIMTKLGCTDGDAMACMRNTTVYEISAVNTNYLAPGSTKTPISMWMPVVDGEVVRSGLWDAFNQGNFVRVPTIIGATTNEGSGFSPSVSSQSEATDFWQAEYPKMNSTHVASINALYSDLTASCDNARCFTKQLKDAYGDMRFMCSGLSFTRAMSFWMPGKTWSYWYNVEDAPGKGVPHCAEMHAIWGTGRASSGTLLSFLNGGINMNTTVVVQGYWSSFIRSYNPNTHQYANASIWQAYSEAQKQRMVFTVGGRTILANVTRTLQDRCSYFSLIASLIGQ